MEKRVNEYHSQIYDYVKINRGVGHTRLLMDGGINAHYPFFIVGRDMSHAKQLTQQMGNKFAIPITMDGADRQMRGMLHPVLIDNFVFTTTCEGYIGTIRDYRIKTEELNHLIDKQKRVLDGIENMPFWIRLFKPLYVRRIRKARTNL